MQKQVILNLEHFFSVILIAGAQQKQSGKRYEPDIKKESLFGPKTYSFFSQGFTGTSGGCGCLLCRVHNSCVYLLEIQSILHHQLFPSIRSETDTSDNFKTGIIIKQSGLLKFSNPLISLLPVNYFLL